jgi:4-amino-4-deoxy-L-arabinose transferase-like glycosyltransferase
MAISESEGRTLPHIAASKPLAQHAVRVAARALPLIAVVALAAATHALNMFHSPLFDDDEGLYMSQAWSVVRDTRLVPAPYTYFYDHPPIGWFTIAAWAKLWGGFDTWGASVNSGRVLMLPLHAAAAGLLFGVVRRAGGSVAAALAAGAIFALSPFQILYGREVLLDNIAVVWMLLATYLLMSRRLDTRGALVSGLALGFALLNKEIVGLMIPGMLLLLCRRLDAGTRRTGVIAWLAGALGLAALYPLHALVIGEFFPRGSLLDFKGGVHTSLLSGIRYHANRAHDLGILEPGSEFWHAARVWWRVDPAMALASALVIPIGALLYRRFADALGFAVMAALFMIFVARGGAVFDYWLLPVVPLAAIIIGLATDALRDGAWRAASRRDRLAPLRTAPALVTALVLVLVAVAAVRAPAYTDSFHRAFAQRQTAPQDQAVAWIEGNVGRDAFIVIDDYAFVDLREAGYARAHSFWRIDTQEQVRIGMLDDDWRNIDYILVTPVLKAAADDGQLPLVGQALANAQRSARFERDGAWTEVWQVIRPSLATTRPWHLQPSSQQRFGALLAGQLPHLLQRLIRHQRRARLERPAHRLPRAAHRLDAVRVRVLPRAEDLGAEEHAAARRPVDQALDVGDCALGARCADDVVAQVVRLPVAEVVQVLDVDVVIREHDVPPPRVLLVPGRPHAPVVVRLRPVRQHAAGQVYNE